MKSEPATPAARSEAALRRHDAFHAIAMDKNSPVASSQLTAAHDELFHYTTIEALQGIAQTRSFWATHYSHLNDYSEIELFRPYVTELIAQRLPPFMRHAQNKRLSLRRFIQRIGSVEKAAYGLAKQSLSNFYEGVFKNRNFVEPFICSFCSHAEDAPFEKEHGLLSQWRAYGKERGVCLVLNTEDFLDLLHEEYDAHYWHLLSAAPVHYAVAGLSLPQVMGMPLERLDAYIASLASDKAVYMDNTTILALLTGATLFKHPSFREEREVRIVAAPGNEDIRSMDQLPRRVDGNRTFKATFERPGSRGPIKYLKLFSELGRPLPLSRVIVGPSFEQERTRKAVVNTVGRHVEVTLSQIPFVG